MLTICFKDNAPDLFTSIISFTELFRIKDNVNLVIIKKNYEELNEEEMMKLIYPSNTHMDFNIASALKYSAEGNGFRLDPGFMEEPEF